VHFETLTGDKIREKKGESQLSVRKLGEATEAGKRRKTENRKVNFNRGRQTKTDNTTETSTEVSHVTRSDGSYFVLIANCL